MRGITNPVDEILELIVTDPRIQDFFDFVFQRIFDSNRRRWGLGAPRDGVRVVGIEKAGVKDRVNLHATGKVEFECHLAFTDDVEDLVRTESLEVEFSRRESCCNVPPGQPYEISNGE